MKISNNATKRAYIWVGMGFLFGFALIASMVFGALFFKLSDDFNVIDQINKIVSIEFMVFLDLALIGGAGLDYILSFATNAGQKREKGLWIVILVGTCFYVYNPSANRSHISELVFMIIFTIICVYFCVISKSYIFYQERLAHEKITND